MSKIDPEKLITISDAADKFGCSRTTIYRALDDGRLNDAHVGDRRFVIQDEAFEQFEPVWTGFRVEKYGDEGPNNSE